MGALERGGDRPAGPRGVRMGRVLGFFESFTFFQIGRRPWAFVGPVALTLVCVFQNDFSTPTRVSLIGTRQDGTACYDNGRRKLVLHIIV